MYTYKVEQAIQAAAILHQDHVRQGEISIPYISHLMSVVLILRDYTKDEDVLVAAILHDTLEDTDYTEAELRQDFGDTVGDIVVALTEPTHDGEDKLAWKEKKGRYAKQLKKGPEAAVLIAAADKAHNFRSIVDQYYEDHDGFLRDFGKIGKDRLDAYQGISNVINSRLKGGIVHEFNHTFNLYKEFLHDVESAQHYKAQ
ncbi:HD domain-containing protein [Candidatus Kaiserbacteria bacterium]|nr:HD domain-containing protein [Candidatus Kaiserbacteria bacterium]